MKLTEEQLLPINAKEKKILVLSAAGASKTTVLINRIGHLLDIGVDPSSIVAITFTRMAADEMRQRLGTKSNGMFVGTIHSYANYICRLNKISNYEEITEEQFEMILKKAISIPQENYPKVGHLLIDEFQDTSELQYSLVEKIPAENLFVVGDDRQVIYSWRNCSAKYINELYFDPYCKKYYLKNNYRSGKPIINFAEKLLKGDEYNSPHGEPIKKKGYVSECSFFDALEEMENYGNWGDWAILCRWNKQIADIAEKLEKKKIPFVSFKKGDLTLEELNERMADDSVKLLSGHSSKGLSFPHVIAVGGVLTSPEERRVSYVMATRAEQSLYWCPKYKISNKLTNCQMEDIINRKKNKIISF